MPQLLGHTTFNINVENPHSKAAIQNDMYSKNEEWRTNESLRIYSTTGSSKMLPNTFHFGFSSNYNFINLLAHLNINISSITAGRFPFRDVDRPLPRNTCDIWHVRPLLLRVNLANIIFTDYSWDDLG